MITHLRYILAMFLLITASGASTLVNGVLMVDGKPFYPLGSWNSRYTTPEDVARLGMNTAFKSGPGSPEALATFLPYMRRCAELGIQMVPYVSYGGEGVTPWPPASVRTVAKLASEPNLLTYYVGDDIIEKHLPGIRQTVSILRKEVPGVVTVADYIDHKNPSADAKATFTRYVDIRCQYTYPFPERSVQDYMGFLDEQRAFVGDPLWTWIQCFMGSGTGNWLGLGVVDGPAPIPEPEQIRLLAFTAVNRGVRGLLFFPHHDLLVMPEWSAEVAYVCREIGLVAEHLAGGKFTMDLTTSDSSVNATSFEYNGSTVVSAMIAGKQYHRWIDEAVVTNVTVDVPWVGTDLPKAALVAIPDVLDCSVEPGTKPGTVRLTIPRLELAGFIMLTTEDDRIAQLRSGALEATKKLAILAVPAVTTQTRKVGGLLWETGFDVVHHDTKTMVAITRTTQSATLALAEGRPVDAVRSWRHAMNRCRVVTDSLMQFALARAEMVPGPQKKYLTCPYTLPKITGLVNAPDPGDPWNYVREWFITGPFRLDGNDDHLVIAPGFTRAFPPETEMKGTFASSYATLDGPAGWQRVLTDISGKTNFLQYFATTEDAVCYARCTVIAPREMDVKMGVGSNDGAKVWVNGKEVFSWYGGRPAQPNEDTLSVHLNAGRNDIMVKVVNLGFNWALFTSFDDPKRELRIEAR
jgi:hypothetical protein